MNEYIGNMNAPSSLAPSYPQDRFDGSPRSGHVAEGIRAVAAAPPIGTRHQLGAASQIGQQLHQGRTPRGPGDP